MSCGCCDFCEQIRAGSCCRCSILLQKTLTQKKLRQTPLLLFQPQQTQMIKGHLLNLRSLVTLLPLLRRLLRRHNLPRLG